jgi:hypothetical protein
MKLGQSNTCVSVALLDWIHLKEEAVDRARALALVTLKAVTTGRDPRDRLFKLITSQGLRKKCSCGFDVFLWSSFSRPGKFQGCRGSTSGLSVVGKAHRRSVVYLAESRPSQIALAISKKALLSLVSGFEPMGVPASFPTLIESRMGSSARTGTL